MKSQITQAAILAALFAATTSLSTAVLASDEVAPSNNIVGFRLDPRYVVHLEPKVESERPKAGSTVRELQGEDFKIAPVTGNHDWFKIMRPNGGEAYVHRNALKKVELNGSYIVHSDASREAHKIGLVSAAKKPQDLVLTGEHKVVKENGKKIEWLEVLDKGKRGWVASGAATNIGAVPAKASGAIPLPPVRPAYSGKSTKLSESVPLPPQRPADLGKKAKVASSVPLPLERPSDLGKHKKTTDAVPLPPERATELAKKTKTAPEKEAPSAAAKVAHVKAKGEDKDASAKPVAGKNSPTKSPDKADKTVAKLAGPAAKDAGKKPAQADKSVEKAPAEQTAAIPAADAKKKLRVASVKIIDKGAAPETKVKPEAKSAALVKAPAKTEAAAVKPATPPKTDVAAVKPAAPAKPAAEALCVRSKDDFNKSARIKNAFPKNYDPFVTWKASAVWELATAQPQANGTWVISTTAFARGAAAAKGCAPVAEQYNVPVQLCVDGKSNQPYVIARGKRISFTDGGNAVAFSDECGSSTFERQDKVSQ